MNNKLGGEFDYTVDEKGRMVLPPEWRDYLGSVVMLARGDSGQIDVYPKPYFDTLLEQLAASDSAAFRRKARFWRAANACAVDRQARVVIPSVARNHAEIGRQVIVVGYGDHAEIWNPETRNLFCQEYVKESGTTTEDVAAFAAELGL